jgi:hypothetical protein
LPSVTALIAGNAIAGSWWAHPLANVIYNALGALDLQFVTCNLVAKKQTLVAPRLWADLVAVGSSRQDWQLHRLTTAELHLLDRVESSSTPVLLADPGLRSAGRRLEERLLVAGDEVHTEAGHHLKAILSWRAWARDRGVAGSLPSTAAAMGRIEDVVARWDAPGRLLPWPASRG